MYYIEGGALDSSNRLSLIKVIFFFCFLRFTLTVPNQRQYRFLEFLHVYIDYKVERKNE